MSTDHYNLSTIDGPGQSFSDDGYKYPGADRRLMDTLLYLGVEGHHHTGETGSMEEPTEGPLLTLDEGGGSIPAGVRAYYKYTLVHENGAESEGSVEAFIDTPNPIVEPGAPILVRSTGGTLIAGNHYYALSEYVGSSINETKATASAYITLPVPNTNTVTVELPIIGGGDGWNLYRRSPGQTKYFHLATIPNTEVDFVDDGSIAEDCDRTLPTANTTNGSNAIIVSIPGATPVVPEGYTWKVYRTYNIASWSNSFLTHVTENVDGDVATEYTDIGGSPQQGSPPAISQSTNSPSKVLLTDLAEVQGTLPMGSMAFPFAVSFGYPGPLEVVEGAAVWRSPFPQAEIISVSATLGRDSFPLSDSVIVDVLLQDENDVIESLFLLPEDRPTVPIFAQRGDAVPPTSINVINRDDLLMMDIIQTDVGASTPNDSDLTVTISLIVSGYPATTFEHDNGSLGY